VPALETRVLNFVSRSLLKEDRLMFALHLVHDMHPAMFGAGGPAGQPAADSAEWQLLLGDVVPGAAEAAGKPVPPWVPPERAPALRLLLGALPDLARGLGLGDGDKWARWAASRAPEADFPGDVAASTPAFRRVLLVAALRPDRLLSALQAFACDALGVPSVSPSPTPLRALLAESAPLTPILMMTTTGADPTRELTEFAGATVGRDRYHELAMGGGQQEAALALLRRAAAGGEWLCLKNLHLVTAWLPALEQALNALKPAEGFRLWLTTEAHPPSRRCCCSSR
jgi:dynein heavy chain 2